jgi:hypothetical protein
MSTATTTSAASGITRTFVDDLICPAAENR